MAIDKTWDDCAPVATNRLRLGVLINLILWTTPNDLAFVVGYEARIVDNAKWTIANRRVICNKVANVIERKHYEPCFATSALARSTNES
jgi:hypothetical protein